MKSISVENLSKSFTRYKKEPGVLGSLKSFVSRKSYSIEAVKSVSFDVDEGEIVGFVGENGAGKSTTLKMMAGLIAPTRGKVNVLGYNPIERKREFLKSISLIMGQKFQLWWDLPAIDSFDLMKEIYEISTVEYLQRRGELVEILDLGEILNTQVRKLSLGQRMKCELVASLLHNPKVIYLDEPTLGLDVVMQSNIRSFLKSFNEKHNATIMLTSHYMEDVKEMCKRIVIIHQGSVIYDGTIAKLTAKYAHEKQISFKLPKKTYEAELRKFGKLSEFDGIEGVLLVDRADVAKVVSKMLNDFNLVDLNISEIDLNEVVRRIFKEA